MTSILARAKYIRANAHHVGAFGNCDGIIVGHAHAHNIKVVSLGKKALLHGIEYSAYLGKFAMNLHFVVGICGHSHDTANPHRGEFSKANRAE